MKLGTRGKMSQSILLLYTNVKSCVKYNNNFSEYFNVRQGVLQNKTLSLLFFSFYLNDFENSYIMSNWGDISYSKKYHCF